MSTNDFGSGGLQHLRQPAPLQAVLPDRFAWRETVAELRSYALCQTEVLRMTDHVGNGASEVFCLSLHRLTQAAVRASPHGQNAGALALGVMGAAFPGVPNNPQYPPAWPRCRSLLPHVQRLQTLYQPGWQAEDRLAGLLTQLALYLKYGLAQYQQAEQLARQAWQMRQTAPGEEHPDTLSSMGSLAVNLFHMGDFPGARAMMEAILTTRRRVQGEGHPDTLISMNNLAVTCYQLGRLQDAQTLMQQAYQGFCRVLGPEHPHTLRAQQWLAKIIAAQA